MGGEDVDPRLRSAQLHASSDRLQGQARLSWQHERQVLRRLGLTDGMAVLDAGSGPGYIAESLLEELPHSQVLAVDLDPAMTAELSARLASRAGDRLTVLTSAVGWVDLPDDAVDFAIARFLFQHLASPQNVLRELLRLLKPGGTLAVIDIDDALSTIVEPAFPSFAVVGQKVAQLQEQRAGNRYVGRRLWRMLAEAGFGSVAIDPIAVHSDEVGLEPFREQMDPERYRPFIGAGGLTQEEWGAYSADVERFFASPDAFILHLLLVVSGRKPAI